MRAAVAVGGALGSVGRVALVEAWPLAAPAVAATLTVNLTGAALLAVVVARVGDPRWRAGLGTGLLGAWTTVSAFGVETAGLAGRGQLLAGLGYVAVTLVGGAAAVRLGTRLADRPAAGAAGHASRDEGPT